MLVGCFFVLLFFGGAVGIIVAVLRSLVFAGQIVVNKVGTKREQVEDNSATTHEPVE